MTFDINNPPDTVKIRNLPLNIRNNFSAIVTGDDSFTQDRVNIPEAIPDTPVVDPTQMRIYSNTQSGNLELYVKDSQNNIIRWTQDGNLGGSTTNIQALGITFDGTIYYDRNNMVIARCSVATAGGNSSSFGIDSAINLAIGEYVVSVTAGLIATDGSYQVLVTPFTDGAGDVYFACINDKPAAVIGMPTEITIFTFDKNRVKANRSFQFIVIGGGP